MGIIAFICNIISIAIHCVVVSALAIALLVVILVANTGGGDDVGRCYTYTDYTYYDDYYYYDYYYGREITVCS